MTEESKYLSHHAKEGPRLECSERYTHEVLMEESTDKKHCGACSESTVAQFYHWDVQVPEILIAT
jgi:hypothetical protein